MPKFWKKRGFLAEVTLPFSVFYYIFVLIKNKFSAKPEKLNVPIICIGNIVAGGSGKTPVAIEVGKIIGKFNKKYAFVSRGYGGKITEPTKVDIKKHTAHDVGDEPLLLARAAPCYIAKNRIEGAKAAIKDGAEIIILDDGMQNNSIEKDLIIMTVDGGFGFGNGLLLPAGPLRGKLQDALQKVDATIIIGKDKMQISNDIADKTPIIHATIKHTDNIDKNQYIAFAGIGRPQKFFDSLVEEGVEIIEEVSFSDHYKYKKKDIKKLFQLAEEKEAKLITTEKDAIRLSVEDREKIAIFPIEVKWSDEVITDLISEVIL